MEDRDQLLLKHAMASDMLKHLKNWSTCRSCKMSSGAPCISCMNLIQLNEKIYESEASLSYLKDARQYWLSRINPGHTGNLPFEILSHIFVFCIADRPIEHLDEPPLKDSTPLTSPLLLGAVCLQWRNVAWSTPRLWSTMVLTASKPCHVGLATEWLGRSGHLPLDIQIDSLRDANDVHQINSGLVQLINQHTGRWERLFLRLPREYIKCLDQPKTQYATNLKILRLVAVRPSDSYNDEDLDHRDYDQDGDEGDEESRIFGHEYIVHHPTHLEINRIRMKNLNIQWSNLRHVSTNDFRIDECLQLLKCAPRLITCRFHQVDLISDTFVPSLLCHDLQSLVFDTTLSIPDDPDIFLFFNNILLASLRDFTCLCNELPLEALLNFFARSECPLEKFTFSDSTMNAAELQQLLVAVPTVTHLDMDFQGIESSCLHWRLLRELTPPSSTHEPPYTSEHELLWPKPDFAHPYELILPRLQEFSYIGPCMLSGSWSAVFNLLRGGYKNERPLRALRLFLMHDDDSEFYYGPEVMQEDYLTHFINIRDSGVPLELWSFWPGEGKKLNLLEPGEPMTAWTGRGSKL